MNDPNPTEKRKIFVGGLTWETQLKEMKEYFEKFGEMESINLRWSPQTGESQCFAVVVFKEASSANEVIENVVHFINGKRLFIHYL